MRLKLVADMWFTVVCFFFANILHTLYRILFRWCFFLHHPAIYLTLHLDSYDQALNFAPAYTAQQNTTDSITQFAPSKQFEGFCGFAMSAAPFYVADFPENNIQHKQHGHSWQGTYPRLSYLYDRFIFALSMLLGVPSSKWKKAARRALTELW